MKRTLLLNALLLPSFALHASTTAISFSAIILDVSDPGSTFPPTILPGSPIEFLIEYNPETAVRSGSVNSSRFLSGLDLNITVTANSSQWILADSRSSDIIEIDSDVRGERFFVQTRGNSPTLYPSFGGEFLFNLTISENSLTRDIVDSADLPETTSDLRIDEAGGGGNFFNLSDSGGFVSDFTYIIDRRSFTIVTTVPEPSNISLLALSFGGFCTRRKRQ